MNSLNNDYRKLYQLQDKFLKWWVILDLPFYLTGGTALGRFYLEHRFSEDLDFFTNSNSRYSEYISVLKKKIGGQFSVNLDASLFTEDFTRFYVVENNLSLKIELVNDVDHYSGSPIIYPFGLIDTPLNILANKLTAIVGRDEPKDVFDIVQIAHNYSFAWPEIFSHSKQKSVINEIDVEKRMVTFPVEWLENVHWLNQPVDPISFKKSLQQIADDFLLGKINSIGLNRIPIESARPIIH